MGPGCQGGPSWSRRCRRVGCSGLTRDRGLVVLDELRPIDVSAAEDEADRPAIRRVSVRAELDAPAQPALEVFQERPAVAQVALPHQPRRDQLRVRADRDPRPHIAVAEGPLVFFGDVALLGVAEPPHLIDLERRTRQRAQRPVLVGGALGAEVHEELGHGVLRGARHADRGADAVALH